MNEALTRPESWDEIRQSANSVRYDVSWNPLTVLVQIGAQTKDHWVAAFLKVVCWNTHEDKWLARRVDEFDLEIMGVPSFKNNGLGDVRRDSFEVNRAIDALKSFYGVENNMCFNRK